LRIALPPVFTGLLLQLALARTRQADPPGVAVEGDVLDGLRLWSAMHGRERAGSR